LAAPGQPSSFCAKIKVLQDPQKLIPLLEYFVVFPAQSPFVHRINADGTIHSFCRKCLYTVASSHREAELRRAEDEHKCDPLRLEYLDALSKRAHESVAEASSAMPCSDPG
jgi:hypothetical protein